MVDESEDARRVAWNFEQGQQDMRVAGWLTVP